jgi:hypothetical protein
MTPIDVASLSPAGQRIVDAGAPERVQELAARGVAPGVRPGELIAVLVLLRGSARANVRETAERTLAALPAPILQGALSSDLPAACVDALVRAHADRVDALARLLAMPQIDGETIEDLAAVASEPVAELIATNEERLLHRPRIIELLYLNRHTRMSTADRLLELAARNGVELAGIPAWSEAKIAIRDELIAEPSPEATPDDLLFAETDELAALLAAEDDGDDVFEEDDLGEEHLKDRVLPLYMRVANMTVTQKIRRAMLGSKDERLLLVRDRNKIVAAAAVRSPLLQEPDAVLIARNRNVSEEVLRILASTPEWMKSYAVKKHLVENPKTPVMLATRLVTQLRESDLKHLAKSKNVTSPVQDAARRHLSRRSS